MNDEESLEVRWHALDALPELDEGNLSRLTRALNSNGEAAFGFSGLSEVLGQASSASG